MENTSDQLSNYVSLKREYETTYIMNHDLYIKVGIAKIKKNRLVELVYKTITIICSIGSKA
jgi:hypothetical protein